MKPADFVLDPSDEAGSIRFSGDLSLASIGDLPERLAALPTKVARIDMTGIDRIDTVGAWIVPASSSTLQIKNVDYSVYSYVRLTAAGTYPYNFSEWRTASGGGGSQISTSANLDLTVSDYTSQQNFYAYFT